jgi:hypothetical protein
LAIVYATEDFYIALLPIQIIFPSMIGKEKNDGFHHGILFFDKHRLRRAVRLRLRCRCG